MDIYISVRYFNFCINTLNPTRTRALWFNDVTDARGQMASTRERAGAAMATVGRRDPDADDVGLNWSCWIDKCHILTDEGE